MSESRIKKLLKLSFAIIILLLIGIVVLGVFFALYATKSEPKLCTKKSCISAANMIVQNMDASVDPCEDFYQFTCGSFLKNRRIPDEFSRLDIFDTLRDTVAYNVADLLSEPIKKNDTESVKKAKTLYASCIDDESLELFGEAKVLDFVNKELGGWPILNEFTNLSSMSVVDRLVSLRLNGISPLFDFSVISNPKSPRNSVLRIKQPSWLVNKEIYKDQKIMSAYKIFIGKIVNYLNSTNKNYKQDVERILDVEKEIAMAQIDEYLRRNSSFKNVTIRDLPTFFPEFEWKKFVDGVFYPLKKNITINEIEIILIDDFNYLVKLFKIYSNFLKNNKRDLENYILWCFIKSKIQFMPKRYRDARFELEKLVRGTTSLPSNALRCSNFVLESMEYVVGKMYVSKYFDGDSKKAATEMINNIQNEFKIILNETDWMDDESKAKAMQKANSIDVKIGYPDFTHNDTYLNIIYKDFNFTSNEYFANQMGLIQTNTLYSLRDLRKKRDIRNWFTGPAVVNAFYSPPANQICFPAGILQSPFYDSSNPNYLNYGGIGTVIGHEITHGFDDRGRLYDKDGIYFEDGIESLWTNKTVKKYKEKAQCIIDQYNKFYSSQVNRSLNGIQTQGENIADNGGLKESFRAYQKWVERNGPEPILPGLNYNQNQLFFINYGQVWCGKFRDQYLVIKILSGHHSPGEFRINGPTSNFDEFAKTFNCKPGQRNNPTKKCSVW